MTELKLDTPLTIDQVDFRVQSINKGGYVTVLVYKDARVDMDRLDAVYGVHGWQRHHTRDNHNCIVSVWDSDKKQWIEKEDVGSESSTEKDKGLASDSFKRACVNLGIGRELYAYPNISIKLNGGGDKPTGTEWFINANKKDRFGNPSPQAGYNLKLQEWVWFSHFEENVLTYLAAKDWNNNLRFEWGVRPKVEK